MKEKKSKKRGQIHNEVLRLALLRLIEIYVPHRFASEREMAEALDFSPAHFSQMKNGFRTIGKDSAEKIEKGLKLDVGGIYQHYKSSDRAYEEDSIKEEDIVTRYSRASESVKLLIDFLLKDKTENATWLTKSMELQVKALIEAISEKTQVDKE